MPPPESCRNATVDAIPRQRDPAASGYKQIFRSSALIGGSSLATVLIGLVRMKSMALLLGPAGVGLMGAFMAVADLTRSVAGMGVNRSGVRQIAAAVGSGDQHRIAVTVAVLRRAAVVLGLAGALVLLIFAAPISKLTFGSDKHTAGTMLLSVAVFFSLVAESQAALLQGVRRIGALAKIGVIGAVVSTAVSVPIVYWLGQDGIVLALGVIAALGALASWYYSRKVEVQTASMTGREWLSGSASLLKLGVAFMASAMMMMSAAYAVRLFVLDRTGLDGAGYFQAAWTLGGLYVGFVLQAMGTDFYPRLVAHCDDHEEANRIVNEQTEISLLLAGPGVIGTIVLAPILTTALYTAEFAQAAEVLRWICVGMALRVITWPMGYIIVAKNKQTVFIAAEAAWMAANIGLSWLLIKHLGLAGAGLAFAASYVFHAFLIYPIARFLTGFRWTAPCKRSAAIFLAMISVVMCGSQLLQSTWALLLGIAVLAGSVFFSLRTITTLLGSESMPKVVIRWISRSRPREGG